MERMDPEGFVRVVGANGLGTDAYRMQYKQYSQMGTRRRDTHATIRDLKVTG